MPIPTREDIHIISSHSNWPESSVDSALKKNVYNNTEAWKKFLRLFFISLGVGFTVSGILFFFAYNWADLHKFAKLGMIAGLIVICTGTVLFSNFKPSTKNIILTGTSVIVGVLFAVYGQIYQTGANAYDFFLGWTLFVTLWVLVSDFAALWLLYLVLLNTTFILYTQQVATGWSEILVFTLLFILNTAFLIGAILFPKYKPELKVPLWFSNTIALAAVTFTTIGIMIGIFESYDKLDTSFLILLVLTAILFAGGMKYGLKEKSAFYLSIIPFSLIIIVSALLIRLSDGFGMLLLVCLFIIGSVTLVIKNLLSMQKKWNHE